MRGSYYIIRTVHRDCVKSKCVFLRKKNLTLFCVFYKSLQTFTSAPFDGFIRLFNEFVHLQLLIPFNGYMDTVVY